MLVCIVCWQHDRKSKCSSMFLCTVKSPSSAGLTLIYRDELYSSGGSEWCWLLLLLLLHTHKAAAHTSHPPCGQHQQQHNRLPRSQFEVPSTTQNTEIRQSRSTLIEALRNFTCREWRLHCTALIRTLVWWSTSMKAATLDGKRCTILLCLYELHF